MILRALPIPCSIADRLELAERVVDPGLVSPVAWERLRAIADPFPPLAQDAGLEIRLETGGSRVDFALCLQASYQERVSLSEAIAGSELSKRSLGWRRALGFVREWATGGSPIHDNVHALWLEFDAEGSGAPEPFLVFALDGERLYAHGTATIEALVTVTTGIDRIAEGAFDPLVAAALERCLRRLPPFAQIRHAALRPTHSGDVARLVVRMPWRRIAGTLDDLGWPGDAAELGATLERLCPHTSVHPVNLDVARDGLGPRVGIEFVHGGAPAESARWQTLFDVLESVGACARERREAIAGWGGEVLGPALGPGFLCVRRDLMVKVIYETGAPLRAKAYLAFAPRLLVNERHEEAPSVPAGSSSGRAPSL